MQSFLALLVLAGPAFAGVRTVAPGGADHTQISAAIASAAPGDVVLVQSGTYAPFAIDGLGLTLLADAGANVVVQGPVAVRNVPTGSVVALSGLRIGAANTSAIALSDCQGSVRLVDLQAWVATNAIAAGVATVRVERCADVALSRCSLSGSPGPAPATLAGCALRAADSALAVHDSTLVGGYGQPGTETGSAGGHGGVALEVLSGSAFLSGAFLAGGPGANGGLAYTGFGGCSALAPRAGGNGGCGLDAASGALVRVLDTSVVGGPHGLGATANCGQHAPDGADGAATLGAVTAIAGSARGLSSSTCAREGQAATFGLRGVPGERVFLFLSNGAGQSWNQGLAGTVLVRVPFWRRVQVGTLGASGVGSASLIAPELGAGVSARMLHVQALYVSPTGVGRLGPARPLVLLDAAY